MTRRILLIPALPIEHWPSMIREGAPTDNATASPELVLVLNWFDELQRLVPTP